MRNATAVLVFLIVAAAGCGEALHLPNATPDAATGCYPSPQTDAGSVAADPLTVPSCRFVAPPLVPVAGGVDLPVLGGVVQVREHGLQIVEPSGELRMQVPAQGHEATSLPDLQHPLEFVDQGVAFLLTRTNPGYSWESVVRVVNRERVLLTYTHPNKLEIVGSDADGMFAAEPDDRGALLYFPIATGRPKAILRNDNGRALLVHLGWVYGSCRTLYEPGLCRRPLAGGVSEPMDDGFDASNTAHNVFAHGQDVYWFSRQQLKRMHTDTGRINVLTTFGRPTGFHQIGLDVPSHAAIADETHLYFRANKSVLAVSLADASVSIAANHGSLLFVSEKLFIAEGVQRFEVDKTWARCGYRSLIGQCELPAPDAMTATGIVVDPALSRESTGPFRINHLRTLLTVKFPSSEINQATVLMRSAVSYAQRGNWWAAIHRSGLFVAGGEFVSLPDEVGGIYPSALATNTSSLFVAIGTKIERVIQNESGFPPAQAQPVYGGARKIGALLADEDFVYWTEPTMEGDRLSRAPTSGGGVATVLAESRPPMLALAQDRDHLYWVQSGFVHEIRRVAKSGGPVGVVATVRADFHGQLAISDGQVAWIADGNLYVVAATGGPVAPFAIANEATSVFADDHKLYWSEPRPDSSELRALSVAFQQ